MKETKYAGTQTEKNLMTAFAGESEARNKYTYFASKAKKEGYEQIAAGIRKMVAAQKDTSKKEEKPVKKAEKKETPVADTPKDEDAPKEKTVDRKTVRAFLAEKSRAGKTLEVKNLIEQFGFQKLSDVPDEKLPELYEKAQVL